MMFVTYELWHLLPYDLCGIMTFVTLWVCRYDIMVFVGYDVCGIMTFVTLLFLSQYIICCQLCCLSVLGFVAV